MFWVVHQWERLRIPGVAQLIRQDIPAVPRGLLKGGWSPVYAGSPKKWGLILGKEIHSKRIDNACQENWKQASKKERFHKPCPFISAVPHRQIHKHKHILMMLATFRVGLSTSNSPIKKIPHRGEYPATSTVVLSRSSQTENHKCVIIVSIY